MGYPLYLALVWHMHQPYYRDSITGQYALPWVRLHATKDYLHMLRVLREFPSVHATFNFVPCLVEQLEDYAHDGAVDDALRLSLQRRWTVEEKKQILEFFFSISWDRVISQHPRYRQLLQLRLAAGEDASVFSDQYWCDLVAWFNLAWIDPTELRRDADLARLIEKGRGYDWQDIELIVRKHRAICGLVAPEYRAAENDGQIEVSCSPYYHPILPLLVDTCSASVASPRMCLPKTRFAHPEDAVEQLTRGVAAHEAYFGKPPAGMWPSEGAVGQEMVSLLKHVPSIRWIASDEGILARSLGRWFDRDGYGHLLDPRPLCQPYALGQGGPSILFRDRLLSDRIGFVYKEMSAQDAVSDFIHRLEKLRETIGDQNEPHIVTVVLDGENAWESYPNNGDDFLRLLYGRLSENGNVKSVTPSEYISMFPPKKTIDNLFTGSWIYANLETWIGERDQNTAWEYLKRTRDALTSWQASNPNAPIEQVSRAREQILMAEGSDWFWWYYSHNRYGHEHLFDDAYRTHLRDVYILTDQKPPKWLDETILGSTPSPSREITGYISPRLTGAEDAGPEWGAAGLLEQATAEGAMQCGTEVLRRLLYGYNPAELYLRIEACEDLANYFVGFYLGVPGLEPAEDQTRYGGSNAEIKSSKFPLNFEIGLEPGNVTPVLSVYGGTERPRRVTALSVIGQSPRVLEVAVSLSDLGIELGVSVNLFCVLARQGIEMELLPKAGFVQFELTHRG